MTQFLRPLGTAIQTIHSSLSIRRIIETGLKSAANLCSAAFSIIILPTSLGQQFKVYIFDQKTPAHFHTFSIVRKSGLEEWLTLAEKPFLSNHANTGHSIADLVSQYSFGEINNSMTVPLKHKQKTLGIFFVLNRINHSFFKNKNLELFDTLAQHTALALINAHNFDGQRHFAQEQKQNLLSTTDQLRRANEKLRQADQSKSENITMIAHELRNPITSISGFAKMLFRNTSDSFLPEYRDFCGIILKNAEHIERLISDLLDFTKLELNKLEMKHETVSCRELMKEAVFSIKGYSPGQEERLHMSLPPREITIEGDHGRLLQVINNLLSNAIKYSAPNTPIIFHCEYNKSCVTFSVEDRGQSLTLEQQQLVFKKFTRLKNPTTHNKSGSGLGLAISQIIIQKLGGEIWIETVPEGGNNFRFTLKRAAEAPLTNIMDMNN